MTADIEVEAWRAKAQQNLASAASELVNGRYDACANRAYYACFQGAIAALLRAGIRPTHYPAQAVPGRAARYAAPAV